MQKDEMAFVINNYVIVSTTSGRNRRVQRDNAFRGDTLYGDKHLAVSRFLQHIHNKHLQFQCFSDRNENNGKLWGEWEMQLNLEHINQRFLCIELEQWRQFKDNHRGER